MLRSTLVCFAIVIGSVATVCQSPIFSLIDKTDGLPSNFVYRVLEDMDGSIWICSNGGVCKYDGQTMKCFDETDGLPDKDIFKITLDDLGRIWLLHVGNKIAFIQNDSVHVYPTLAKPTTQRRYKNKGGDQGVRIGKDWYFVIDGENNITQDKGSFWFKDPQGLTWENLFFIDTQYKDTLLVKNTMNGKTTELLEVDVDVQTISQYHHPSQTFQIYTGNKIYVYDTLLQFQETIDINLSKDFNIHSALRDRWGNLWICTRKGIFFQSYGQRIYDITLQEDAKGINIIRILESRNGTIIIDEYGGVYKLVANTLHLINRGSIHNGLIYDAQVIDEYLYLSSGLTGLIKIDICKKEKSDFILVSKGSKDFVVVDSQRAFLAGYTFREVDIEVNSVVDIKKDFYKQISYDSWNKTIWLNTADSLYVYEDNEKKDLKISFHFPFIENIKYIGNGKTMITTAKRKNYICTDIDCNEVEIENNVHVKSISVLKDIVWLNTDTGVLKSNFSVEDNNVYSFIPYFNYNSLETETTINDISVYDDYLLLGTENGIFRVGELSVSAAKTTIPINIDYLNQSKVDGSDFVLQYEDRNVSIAYSANYFTNRDHLWYEYFLNGYEQDTTVTNMQEAEYFDLASGNYVFNVRAFDSFGNESKVAQMNFCINKPWFHRPIVYILAFLILSVIGYYLFKYYMERVNKRNLLQQQFSEMELSALQSQMNPHFVFNAMNSIQNLITSDRLEEADLYVTRLAVLMRKYLESSKEKYISIEEELEIVQIYLQLEELRFGNKISYFIDNRLDREYSSKRVPATIIQPFVENSLKHGLFHKVGKGNLYIKLYNDDQNIFIEIEDDGVGRKRVREIQNSNKRNHKSTGMQSINSKLEVLRKLDEIDIDYEVIDLYNGKTGSGTKVVIRMSNK